VARHADRPGFVSEVPPDRAGDQRHRETRECEPSAYLEPVDRLKQPYATGLNKVFKRLDSVVVATSDMADQRQKALRDRRTRRAGRIRLQLSEEGLLFCSTAGLA